jgi:hypothetical protein
MAGEEWFLTLKENEFNTIAFDLEMCNKFIGQFQ